ncbi:MAG: hypothetical protein DRQ62_14825 [Gammaproteobacteria bacterium]|nr:MAG: hypothetical protein DRQ62_14825 [Gammaproteobacteria bacterium]
MEQKELLSLFEMTPAEASFTNEDLRILQGNWSKRQKFRTETEARISILEEIRFPTKASKYWQCIREQGGMYEELIKSSFECRRKLLEIDDIKKRREEDNTDPYLSLDLEEALFNVECLKDSMVDRIRELKMWHLLMVEYDDGTFDTEDVNMHQLDSYNKRFIAQAEVMGANGSPSENFNLVGQLRASLSFLKEEKSCTNLTAQINEEINDRKMLR